MYFFMRCDHGNQYFSTTTAYEMNFADNRVRLESLCVKSTTQRTLKHQVPSIRALHVSNWLLQDKFILHHMSVT